MFFSYMLREYVYIILMQVYVIFLTELYAFYLLFSLCLRFHSFFLPNNIRQRDCRRKLGCIYINVNIDDM